MRPHDKIVDTLFDDTAHQLPEHSAVRTAVWHASNTYLWKRVSEADIRRGIADDMRLALPNVDEVVMLLSCPNVWCVVLAGSAQCGVAWLCPTWMR